MFEKEYRNQKVLLFIVMVFIIGFTFQHCLPEKNGISFQEGQNYCIANASEKIEQNPYQTVHYRSDKIKKELIEVPFIIAFYNSFCLLLNLDEITLETNQVNSGTKKWLNSDYYTNALAVSDISGVHYGQVIKNCILSQKSPFYYCILYTFSAIFGYFQLYYLGFIINSFFWLISSFLLLSIAKRYLHAPWAGVAAVLLFSLSNGCRFLALNATPYFMLLFFVLVSVELHLSTLYRKQFPAFLCISMIIVTTLAILTDYAYLLFGAAIGVCFCLALLLQGRYKDILHYLCQSILSLIVVALIYPAFVLHIGTFCKKYYANLTAFSFIVFKRNAMNNLIQIKNLFLTHTIFFVFSLTALLVLVAFCSKRKSLRQNFVAFLRKVRGGTDADVFIAALQVVFFLVLTAVTVFADVEIDFVLFSFLPVTVLLFAYLVYRLFSAVISSAYNSGILSVVSILVICFLNLFSTPTSYIYGKNTMQTVLAKAHQQEYCIFLVSPEVQKEDYISELQTYEHSLILNKDNIKSLKSNKTFLAQDSMLVYLTEEEYINATIDKIARIGKFNLTEEVSKYQNVQKKQVHIYKLRRMGRHGVTVHR